MRIISLSHPFLNHWLTHSLLLPSGWHVIGFWKQIRHRTSDIFLLLILFIWWCSTSFDRSVASPRECEGADKSKDQLEAVQGQLDAAQDVLKSRTPLGQRTEWLGGCTFCACCTKSHFGKKRRATIITKKWVTGTFLLYLINNVYWLCNRRMQRTKLM